MYPKQLCKVPRSKRDASPQLTTFLVSFICGRCTKADHQTQDGTKNREQCIIEGEVMACQLCQRRNQPINVKNSVSNHISLITVALNFFMDHLPASRELDVTMTRVLVVGQGDWHCQMKGIESGRGREKNEVVSSPAFTDLHI